MPRITTDWTAQVSEDLAAKRPLHWFNILFLTMAPIIAVVASTWYAMEYGITWREILASVCLWFLTGLGITAGYHRRLSPPVLAPRLQSPSRYPLRTRRARRWSLAEQCYCLVL